MTIHCWRLALKVRLRVFPFNELQESFFLLHGIEIAFSARSWRELALLRATSLYHAVKFAVTSAIKIATQSFGEYVWRHQLP